MRSVWVKSRRRAPLTVFVCLACIATTVASADPCTKFFVSNGSTDNITWHVDENWSPVGVPAPVDVACILEEGGYQVVVTEPVTVAGLQIDVLNGGPKVKIIATDFTLNGSGYLAGSTKLKINDGAVLRSDSGGVIEVHSTLVIEGGIVEVDVELYGHLNWWGPSSITGTLNDYPGSVIEVEDAELAAHLSIAEGFELNGTLVFNNTIEQSLTVISGPLVITSTGMISSRKVPGFGSTTPELHAELLNNGVIDVVGLDLRLARGGSQHQNAAGGEIQVAAAELEIDLGGLAEVPSNFTNYGTTTVAGGGSIRIRGASGSLEVPSNFTNYGTTTVATGGSIRIIGSNGRNSAMSAVNLGFIDIESNGLFGLTDAIFDNPASGHVRGSGTLDLIEASDVVFDGTLSPGLSPGILTVDGSMDVGPSTVIDIEVGGETPGTNLDRLDLTGLLGAGGSLAVNLLDSYHPVGGEQYQVVTYDQLDGWFDKVELPVLMNLLAWSVNVGANDIRLDVVCEGTQLGIGLVPDRDPVSVGYEVLVHAGVRNHSSVTATEVVVSSTLPAELSYRVDLSSPECRLIGASVECSIPSLAPAEVWNLIIAVEPVVAGPVDKTGWVTAWECDTDGSDDQSVTTIRVVAAEPCDANDDLSIDADDLVAAVGHIFGETAAGNPDCRLANGITADDLAAIIETIH